VLLPGLRQRRLMAKSIPNNIYFRCELQFHLRLASWIGLRRELLRAHYRGDSRNRTKLPSFTFKRVCRSRIVDKFDSGVQKRNHHCRCHSKGISAWIKRRKCEYRLRNMLRNYSFLIRIPGGDSFFPKQP
jgi:hypothetical protein